MNTEMENNAEALRQEFNWLSRLINYRITELTEDTTGQESPLENPPSLQIANCPYHAWLEENQADMRERLALTLALAGAISPESLELLYIKSQYTDEFLEIYGLRNIKERMFAGYQTLAFLLYGNVPASVLTLGDLAHAEHRLYGQGVLDRSLLNSMEPYQTPLALGSETLRAWSAPSGLQELADLDLPANELTTELEWEDLAVENSVAKKLEDIRLWLTHGESLRNDPVLRKHIKPGLRLLFYGPPGTGKTLTATLLGKQTGFPVYRVDLSMMVSKWVGETEKNLERLFLKAEGKNWILFFDEADSLFAARTEVNSGNDRFGNQQVSYLLQRIENYDGLVVLASNLKDNLDEAFTRRFQEMIYFPLPDAETRELIWQNAFSPSLPLAPEINIKQLATKYELSGGSLINVVRDVSLRAFARQAEGGDHTIQEPEVTSAVRRELAKSGIYMVR